MTKTESNIILFSITLAWASSVIFIKNIPPEVSTYAYLTMTSLIASVILGITFYSKLKQFTKTLLFHSFVLAIILCGTLVSERMALQSIPASLAAFVGGLTIVFVPLLLLLFLKQRPSRNNLLGILCILIGLGFNRELQMDSEMGTGMLAMVVSCLFTSVFILVVDNFAKKSDPLLLGIGQIFFSAVIGFALWFIEEPRTFWSVNYTNELLANIFMLAFFAKAYAYIMLMYSQKYATPIAVTLISSTEPVVTLVLALLIPNAVGQTEYLTLAKVAGSTFIVLGAIVAGANFLEKKSNEAHQSVGG